jgi:hypothetical protein
MQTDAGDTVADNDIRLVTPDMSATTRSQLQALWTRKGDRVQVALVSTTGMQAYEACVAIGLRQGNRFTGQPDSSPEIQYYDLTGEPVSGPGVSVLQDGVLLSRLP